MVLDYDYKLCMNDKILTYLFCELCCKIDFATKYKKKLKLLCTWEIDLDFHFFKISGGAVIASCLLGKRD